MKGLSWDLFRVYNNGKNLTNLFEELCIDYFIKKKQINQNDIVVIDPNNPGIETHPLNDGTIGVQSKFLTEVRGFKPQIQKSLIKEKIINYKTLKEIIVISNVDFDTTASGLLSEINGYRNRNINIKYLNGKTFLRELEKDEFYDLQYNYFGKNNFGGFLKNQQIKYNDYSKNGIDKTVISLTEAGLRTKINTDNFLDKIIFKSASNKSILIAGSPGSGKSLLFTYFIDKISSKFSINKILPICINLIKRDGSSLISYINKNLSDFGLSDFNSFQKIILFFDGWNEMSFDKCELLKSEIEFLNNHCNNVLKTIISTRTGSIKNNFLEEFTVKYILNSTYKFEIEKYIQMSYKSIEHLPILNQKKEKLDDVLGKIALTTDFYDESNLLSFDKFQETIKTELVLLNNTEINSVIDFIFDTNILYKTNYGAVVFGDQKIYEYFLSNYIANHFLGELSVLRKYNFFYKSTITEELIKKLNKVFLNKSFADKVVKNLFINRLSSYSPEESGWGFDFSELFLKSLLNFKGFELYMNENKDIKRIFDNNYINPKTVFELKNLGKFDQAKNVEYKFKENLKTRLDEWRNWYKSNDNQDKHIINEKYRSLKIDQFYKDYHYELINNLKLSKKKIEQHFKKKYIDPILMNEIVLFLIFLLESNHIALFEKCILGANSKVLFQEFNKELTKTENIYLYRKIPKNIFKKLYEIYSFKKLIAGIKNISYFSDAYDHIISGILIYILYKRVLSLSLNIEQLNQVKEVIYQDKVFHQIGELGASSKIGIETKVLFISALLDGEKWSIYPISDEYQDSRYLPKTRSLVGLLYWFICNIDGINNNELIDPYLLFYNTWEKLHSRYQSIDMVHSKILYSLVKYLIHFNKFSGSLFRVFIQKKIDDGLILSLLIRLINETNFKDFDYSLIDFLEKQILENKPYNENYNNLLMLSYICSINNRVGLSNSYFEKALNHTYIRYGRRKDYYFDFVIDTLSEGYKMGYITSNEVYENCIRIGSLYSNLIDHVDGKGTRQIPALLITLLGESAPEKISDFKQNFPDREGGWYCLMGEFSSLLKRISKYENIETLLSDIKELSENYTRYYKEVEVIKLILLIRLNSIGYYLYGDNDNAIRKELAELIKDFPIKSFKDLQMEISHLNWSSFDENLFISDLRKNPLSLDGSIEDLIKDKTISTGSRTSIIDLDFTDNAVYDEILEDHYKYDISSLTEEQLGFLLEKFKSKFPNYMEKIVNSSLFGSVCGNMYFYYGEDFSIMFGMKVYSLNPGEFKKCINKKLSNSYGDYYFTNVKLVGKILVQETHMSDYKKLIDNLLGFSDLLCL